MSRTNFTDVNPDVFCTGKRAFGSLRQAAEAASKTSHGRGIRCNTYRCTECGMYHYGRVDYAPRQRTQRRQRNFEKEQ